MNITNASESEHFKRYWPIGFSTNTTESFGKNKKISSSVTVVNSLDEELLRQKKWLEENYFDHYYMEENFNLPKIFSSHCENISDFISKNKIHAQFEKGFTIFVRLEGSIIENPNILNELICDIIRDEIEEGFNCEIQIIGNYLSIKFFEYSEHTYKVSLKIYKKLFLLKNASKMGVSVSSKTLEKMMKEKSKVSLKDSLLLKIIKHYN